MPINDFQTSILSWSPDGVVPQLCLPTRVLNVQLQPSTVFPKGSWIAQRTDTPGIYDLYASGGANGTGTPVAILPRAYATDSSGNIFSGAQASSEIIGVFELTVPAWSGGAFKQIDLASLDAGTLTALKTTYPGAAVVRGSIAAGNAIIQF